MIAFPDLARQAGAGPPLVNYKTAKGLDRTATLALIVDNVADLVHQVVEPFTTGCTINGVDHSAQPEHHATVQAIVAHMWREARRQWDIAMAPPPSTPALAAAPATTVTSTGMTVDPDEKILKTFAHWATQIDVYSNRLSDGKKRRFPENNACWRGVRPQQGVARTHQDQGVHAHHPRRDPAEAALHGVR